MRYPRFLAPGDTVGLVAPSFGCAGPFGAGLDAAIQELARRGHPVKEGENCRRAEGLGISASPEACGRELMQSYCDPESRVLISCGGGELMCRDLDFVDFSVLAGAEPKWFMGYSDNTNFSFLLTTLCDVASIYGPCVGSLAMEPWHPAIQDAWDLLTGRLHPLYSYFGYQDSMFLEGGDPRSPYAITRPLQLTILPTEPVEFRGRLLGGCLDVLVNLRGTAFDRVPDFIRRYQHDGIIWFLEACDLNVWSICRALWQLEHSGWFQYVRGFVFGRPLCNGQRDGQMDQLRAVTEILGKYQVPLILDADLGHLPPSMPLICGSMATVRAGYNRLSINMELI